MTDILTLETSYQALPSIVGQARREVVELAEKHGASEEDLERIRLAISEAVSNAVIHAYDEEPERLVHLTAATIDGELTVLVADDGCGLGGARQSNGLGLGLAVITQLCDSLTVMTRSFGGTEIEMRFRLANAPRKAAGSNQLRGSVSSASRPA